MSIKIIANSQMGNFSRCEFLDKDEKVLYYTKTILDKNHSKTEIFNNKDQLVSGISYEFKQSKIDSLILKLNDKEIPLLVEGNVIKSEDLGISLKTGSKFGFLNLNFDLRLGNISVMKAIAKSFIRQWLTCKYSMEVLDENQVEFCISMMTILFIVLADEAISSERNYMGNFS